MTDIQNRADIEMLVNTFYQKLLKDDEMAHFFTKVMQLKLEVHLPIICDFWESILLGNMIYRGNPMIKHIELHKKSPLTAAHFNRWLGHWEKTLHAHFAGPRVIEALKRAKLMGDLMQFKIQQSEKDGFIQ